MRVVPARLDELRGLIARLRPSDHRRPRLARWQAALHAPFESLDDAYLDLLRLGADIEVIEPMALRTRIASRARALVALYGA